MFTFIDFKVPRKISSHFHLSIVFACHMYGFDGLIYESSDALGNLAEIQQPQHTVNTRNLGEIQLPQDTVNTAFVERFKLA